VLIFKSVRKAMNSRVTMPAMMFAARVVIAVLMVAAAPAFAQPASAPTADQKIDQLVKLLGDPEVRALLDAKAPAPSDTVLQPDAAPLTRWIDGVHRHLRETSGALPDIPAEIAKASERIATDIDGHGPTGVFLLFLVLIGFGFGAEWLFTRVATRIHRRHDGIVQSHGLHRVGRQIFVQIAPLIVFGMASMGVFVMLTWPPLLNAIMLPLLMAVIACRFVLRLARIVLQPGQTQPGGSIRLVSNSDGAAVFWYRRFVVFFAVLFAGWACFEVMKALLVPMHVASAIVYGLGLALLATAIETIWNRPRPPGHLGGHDALDWVMILWLFILWGIWVSGSDLILWLGIYVLILPSALKNITLAIRNIYAASTKERPENPVYEVLLERGARAAVIALAVVWLVVLMQFHPTLLSEDGVIHQFLRGILGGIVIILAADILWQIAKALIGRKLEQARSMECSDAEQARRGRLQTLLPILRNFLAVLIAVIAILMVLSGLGIEIAPLIAGAGIFGVALGFGSQTLVKDVISGIFYMLDDAFRVGEYIQSGSYKGTVESFSIRSVKLRHHRGPIFTVPFGMLGAVENMSRDWVIDKFLISVSYQTDLNKVKRLIKGVGAELLEDPEFGPLIIETVKMKGVEQFGDYGINLSFAMTTRPGQQTTVRRRALAIIRDVFTENGIAFASPSVQVASDNHDTAASVAAAGDAMARKKATPPEEA